MTRRTLIGRTALGAACACTAERWEVVEPTRWRFYLRKGVKFQNGEDFTADDVVFSATRVLATGSDVRTRLPADIKVVKVDDHTVDFVLSGPNPILHYEWDTWYIMSKKWAEANNSVMPQPASGVGLRDTYGSLVNARKENRRHAQPGAQPEIRFTLFRDLYDRAFTCRHAADGRFSRRTGFTSNTDRIRLRLDRRGHAWSCNHAGKCEGGETAGDHPRGRPLRFPADGAWKVRADGDSARV